MHSGNDQNEFEKINVTIYKYIYFFNKICLHILRPTLHLIMVLHQDQERNNKIYIFEIDRVCIMINTLIIKYC